MQIPLEIYFKDVRRSVSIEKLIRENFDIISKTDCKECNQDNHYLYKAHKL